jgi:hypothetical protein
LTRLSFSSSLLPPIWLGRYPLGQLWHSQEHQMICHNAELSDPKVGGSVHFWTALPSSRRYQHNDDHIVAGNWTFGCTHSHYRSLVVDTGIPVACSAWFLLKCGARGMPCRTHSMTHCDCIEEQRYMWPTRQLRNHGVVTLRIRSSGAQSSEAVRTWIQSLEASG